MPLTLKEIIKTTRMLVNDRLYHNDKAAYYYRLFNQSNPVAGNYTPLEKFYESMAIQHMHVSMMLDAKIDRFTTIVDCPDAV